MSETLIQTEEVPQSVNPFDEASWVSSQAEAKSKVDEPVATTEEQAAKPATTETNEEVVDANEYLKTNLGYDNWEAAKTEIEELRKLKEQKPQDFKFENETSEKLFNALREGKEQEIYNYLHQKNQLDRVKSLDVSDPKNAAEVIRLNLKFKYKDLNDDEVSDIFHEQYEKPAKPKQTLEQDDAEYEETIKAWELRCNGIDRKMIRDAKMVKPEVEQFSQKLVLPDIPVSGTQVQNQPTQEELAALKAQADSFIKSAESVVGNFNDYSVAVKNNDVDLSVKYGFSQEEKAAVSGQLKQFAETGFDANALFASRWLNQDGNINVEQVVKDLSLLNNGDKITQKFVTEAANQRLEAYIKSKKNVDVTKTNVTQRFDPQNQQGEMEKLREQVWQ